MLVLNLRRNFNKLHFIFLCKTLFSITGLLVQVIIWHRARVADHDSHGHFLIISERGPSSQPLQLHNLTFSQFVVRFFFFCLFFLLLVFSLSTTKR